MSVATVVIFLALSLLTLPLPAEHQPEASGLGGSVRDNTGWSVFKERWESLGNGGMDDALQGTKNHLKSGVVCSKWPERGATVTGEGAVDLL